MAFVEVIRRSMRPEEYTDLRFNWLKRYIYADKAEITGLQVRDARQVGENTYEDYPGGWRVLRRGDLYFTPDGTAFFRVQAAVPESMRGRELWLHLWTAAEVIVKVNGRYVGGIDPNRDRVLLSPYIDTHELVIEMEGYNRSKPDDERNPDAMNLRGCRQEFNGLYFATLRHEALDLFYDLQLLLDMAKSVYFNEDYRKFLNIELSRALDLIDFDTTRAYYDGDVGLLRLPAALEADFIEQVRAARAYIEQNIYQNDDFKGSGNVALVGHSHLDLAYYWRRIHTVHKNARTVLIQMRLMDRYPDFKYTHTQAYTYELLETYYPELFAELKEKVAAGQFEPVGAMYVEPDCNIPSAESLIRQLLYGQHYFREKFGMTVNNAWLPDVFGNSWIMPQILRKSGVDYFVSNKMSTWNDTNRFPHNNFIWKGIDGTEIYASVPPTHFITWNMPSQIQENWEAYQDKGTGGQTLSMFGYGDGGSGVTEEMLELMHRFDKLSAMPKTEHMTARQFLEQNLKGNQRLDTWDGELYLEMHRGTFTTKAALKRANRELEFAFRDAELLNVLRIDAGEPAADGTLRAAYKKFLVNQFHDILPGSHIRPVFEDAMADLNAVRTVLAEQRGTGEHWFNSLNFTRRAPVFIPEENGSVTRCGVAGRFVQPELPAFAAAGTLPPLPAVPGWLQTEGNEVETPLYRLTFDAAGSILRLYDKSLDREWVEPDGVWNRLHLYQDLPGVYDAWDILPNYKDRELTLTVTDPLHLSYQDETMAEFTSVVTTAGSRWKRVVRLFAAHPMIEVENDVDWHETHKLAKMEFDINVLARHITCDTSAGTIQRETHRNTTWQKARFEVCSHKWCDVSEPDGGVAFINEGLYGIGIGDNQRGIDGDDGGIGLTGNKVTLSLLRATMRPDITSDRGQHQFCFQILPHADGPVQAGINRFALEQNIPLRRPALPAAPTGALADLLADLADAGDRLVLQAIKRSEDGSRIIVRLSEQDGCRGTLRLRRLVQPTNMLEDDTGTPARQICYKPFEILTFACEL